MRQPLTLALVCLFVLPVHAQDRRQNELTVEEIADGWILLFDGQTASQWKIEGEYEIVDGVLILGGKADGRAFLPLTALRDFEVRLQYRTEGLPIGVIVGVTHRNTGSSFPMFKTARDWHDAYLREYWDMEFPTKRLLQSDTGACHASHRMDGVWIEARAGQRVFLRNIKMKYNAPGPWLWLLPLLFVAVGFAVLTAWRWKRHAKLAAREHNLATRV